MGGGFRLTCSDPYRLPNLGVKTVGNRIEPKLETVATHTLAVRVGFTSAAASRE